MCKEYTCQICNKPGLKAKSLSAHLKGHKISSRVYYDTYLKSPNEGTCVICGNTASFSNMTRGYGRTCSRACLKLDPQKAEQIIATKKRKYGEDMSAIYDKQKETVQNWSADRKAEYHQNLSNGVKQAIAADPTISKRRLATIMASGIDIGARISAAYTNRTKEETDATTERRKQTMLEKYGVSHTMLVPEMKAKALDRDPEAVLLAAKKRTQTRIANGSMLHPDDPARDAKKDYKYQVRQISERWAKQSFTTEELAKRSLNGTDGGVQLDHIVSLEECYNCGVSPEIAGHISNLRIISWEDNITKNRHSSMTVEELLHKYTTHEAPKDW